MRRQERVPWDHVEGRGHCWVGAEGTQDRGWILFQPCCIFSTTTTATSSLLLIEIENASREKILKITEKKAYKSAAKSWIFWKSPSNRRQSKYIEDEGGKYLQHFWGEPGSLPCPIPGTPDCCQCCLFVPRQGQWLGEERKDFVILEFSFLCIAMAMQARFWSLAETLQQILIQLLPRRELNDSSACEADLNLLLFRLDQKPCTQRKWKGRGKGIFT